jgi:uncharacterized protein DUF2631
MTGMAERADAAHGGTAHGDAATGPPRRHEQPGDWGWHGSWGKWSRIGAWISAISLIAINFTWHYNQSADPWLYGSAALLILILLRDRYRRKNAWRDE